MQVALATQPAGLQLTLDGQPVTAPHTPTGVVGVERDLGAADQDFNGRSYRFGRWSDGGAATHTISTPVTNRTYTAGFIDLGPVANPPPTVALSAPAINSTELGTPMTLTATARDSDGTIAKVEFFDCSTAIGEPTPPRLFGEVDTCDHGRAHAERACHRRPRWHDNSAAVR